MSESTTSPRTRSWSTRLVAWLAFAGFAGVITAIELMAVRGQLDFAQHVMGLSGAYVYVVPVALEGGTLVSAALALWAVLQRDRSFSHRVWTALFLGGAAGANYVGALAAGRSEIAAVYLAAFCVAALRMWHAILHRVRRDALPPREADPRIARFRLARWLLAPVETFRAWSFSVREGVFRSADALAAVRGAAVPSVVATADGAGIDLTKASKAEATRTAFAELGSFDVAPTLVWLAAHGVSVDRSYVYELARKEAGRRRAELHSVNGSSSRKAVAA